MAKKARQQAKARFEHKTMLQIRVLHQDQSGKISDVTQDEEEDRAVPTTATRERVGLSERAQ